MDARPNARWRCSPISPRRMRPRDAFSATRGATRRRWRSTRRRLRLDPDGYEVNCAAARCYIGMRRNEDAIGCLERAAAAIETDFWALGMAVQCYEAVGDGEGVKSAARRCLDAWRRPSSPNPIMASPSDGA